MTWPALLFWLLIIVGAIRSGPFILYLFFFAVPFGGLSLLPPSALGNVPVTTVCAAVLIGKTFIGRGRFNILLGLALDARKLGLLTLFCLYMVITAFIYPRLLAGHVQLYALNFASNISFLRPSSANITQPIYMLVSILMAFVFADRGRDPLFRQHFLNATLFGACVLLATGLIDTVMGDIGREDLLAPFHNATYHLLDTVSIAGQKRVVGFMAEASSYGAACLGQLGFLLFNRVFYRGVLRDWVTPVVIIGLLYMVYASTSSGAYVGMAILFTVVTVRFLLRMIFASELTPAHLRQIFWVLLLALALAVGYLFLPQSVDSHFRLLLDETLFQKSSSSSYIERGAWTHAGIAAFVATGGVGVGVGSIRTSNWYVNFAASTGIAGIILFGGFVVWMLLPSRNYPDAGTRHFATALKLSLIPGSVVRALSGTTPDPGVETMLILGLIYALRQKSRAKTSQNIADLSAISSTQNISPVRGGILGSRLIISTTRPQPPGRLTRQS